MKITRTTRASAVPSRTAAAPAVLAAALTIALAGPPATANAGTGWTERPAPFALGTSGLTDVTAAAPDAVRVGGYQWRRTVTPYFCGEIGGPCVPHVWQNPALQAGDGDSWSWLGTPGMTGAGQITEVDAVSATDTWAAGRRDSADGKACGPAYVAHGTGGGWSELPEPDGLGCLEALVEDGAGGLWATADWRGVTGDAGLVRYTGGAWEWAPALPGSKARLDGLTRVPGTSTLIAAGTRDGKPIVLARD
ncbi:hypothetical protein GCM10010182_66220 [Actinomadura cremea]|nr:hypothetical protein GCM10010182_66220 [Actinomadura cremea]